MQHTNSSNRSPGIVSAGGNFGVNQPDTGPISSNTATPHNNLQPYVSTYTIIKTWLQYSQICTAVSCYPTAYPHSLRHTFTTTMLRQGADISHVQRLLGHSNISTTARYTHLVTDDIKKAHAKFLIEV